MEQVKNRIRKQQLEEVLGRYNIHPDQVKHLASLANLIYEFERGDESYILRIGHTTRRNGIQTMGEIDWLNHLKKGGAGIAYPVPSASGEYVEEVDDGKGGQFVAVSFTKAKGKAVDDSVWNERLFEAYGKHMGRIHALSQTYELPNEDWRRPEWDLPGMYPIETFLPESDAYLVERFFKLKDHMMNLPKNSSSYGLTHQDPHKGNFFVDEDYTITMYDFDDCCYAYFIHDLAMVLFYAALHEKDRLAFAQKFLPPFLKGYAQENKLDPVWLKELPHFMKFREMYLYAIAVYIAEKQPEAEWTAKYISMLKHNVENEVPYIELDFEKYSDLLR